MSRSPSYGNSLTWMSTVHSFAAFFRWLALWPLKSANRAHLAELCWTYKWRFFVISEIVWVERPVNNRMLNLLARAPAAGTSIIFYLLLSIKQALNKQKMFETCRHHARYFLHELLPNLRYQLLAHQSFTWGITGEPFSSSHMSIRVHWQASRRVACNCTTT